MKEVAEGWIARLSLRRPCGMDVDALPLLPLHVPFVLQHPQLRADGGIAAYRSGSPIGSDAVIWSSRYSPSKSSCSRLERYPTDLDTQSSPTPLEIAAAPLAVSVMA
jgi:hypothetical protein